MSGSYTDTVLRALTKNCRAEVRKEFKEQLAQLPKLEAEIKRLKRELNKAYTKNEKLERGQAKVQEAERFIADEYKNLGKRLGTLRSMKVATFITGYSGSDWYRDYVERRSKQAAIRALCGRVAASKKPARKKVVRKKGKKR